MFCASEATLKEIPKLIDIKPQQNTRKSNRCAYRQTSNIRHTRGGALRVKISRGTPLEVQNGTQQDLDKMIDLVNLGGKKIVNIPKTGVFEMGPNKIWMKW